MSTAKSNTDLETLREIHEYKNAKWQTHERQKKTLTARDIRDDLSP